MSIQAPALDAPAPQLLFKRRIRPFAMVRELWGSRDLWGSRLRGRRGPRVERRSGAVVA